MKKNNQDELLCLRIAQLCNEKGVSFREASIDLEKSSNYIQNIVTGKKRPSLPALYEICDYFSISLCQFFNYTETGINDSKFHDKIHNATPQQLKIMCDFLDLLNKNGYL